MNYRLCDLKVLQAIDCIVRDVDKKYDECLVDRFLEFIEFKASEKGGALVGTDSNFDDTLALMDRIKYFTDHKAFVMLNQARAFKAFYSVLKSTELSDVRFSEILPHLDSLWHTLDMIIINDNLSALTVILSIFSHLTHSETGYHWLTSQTIDPPLRYSGSDLRDVTNLVEQFIDCKNYHTKNKVETLFQDLICNSKSIDCQQRAILAKLIQNLLLKGSMSMVHILNNIITTGYTDLEQFDVANSLRNSFAVMLKQPRFINFCRCIALTSSLSSLYIEDMKKSNQLKGLIVYLSHFDDINSLVYLLYPLLFYCEGDETDSLKQELRIEPDDVAFIDKNINKTVITLCLVQLKRVKNYFNSRLVIDTLITYVKCHWNIVADYKDVMECCSVLLEMRDKLILTNEDSLHLLEILHSTLSDIKLSEQTKPVFMKLLKILQFSHFQYSISEDSDCDEFTSKTIDLAYRTTDHEILDEFVQFFKMNPIACKSGNTERYVDLVWSHIYLNSKDTEHRELLGNLAHLLVSIDLETDSSTLEAHGIRHHHDIPIILGDLLVNRFAIIPTVELIIESLNFEEFQFDQVSLTHLAEGLYITVKGEASEETRLEAFRILRIINEHIISSYSCESLETLEKYIDTVEKKDNKMELHSMVEDILNYDLLSDGILDCY